ncbi:MAG: amidohydrolase family protein [Planctomycetota bacterium]|jgi:imidazolonepropionase-like amidohydrolase
MMVSKDHNKTANPVDDAGPRAGPRPTATGLITVALALCIAQALSADEPVTAIKGGDLYTITSGVVKDGIIVIRDGKISQIGRDLEIPEDAKVIDASGKVVMPGLVAATTWNLPAVDTSSEKIAESLDPFNYSVSMALASGVTSMFVGGSGSPFYGVIRSSDRKPIGGTNAVIKPTYGDLDSMLVKEPVVENIRITGGQWMQKTEFILKMREARDYLQRLAAREKPKQRDDKAEASEQPKEQSRKTEAPKKPAGVDPYIRLLKREMSGRLTATTGGDILAVLELVDEFRFRLIIEDAVEAWTVVEEIARRDVALIITPRAKRRPNEQISRPSGSSVENAALLSKAGVKFAIVPPSPAFETWGVAGRDLMTLPMEAAFAVSGGLDERTALEAITITAAEILGIEDRVGSLQVGKDADIIILDGHPFHYNTFVEFTFVNGKLLYDKSKSTYFSHIRHYDDKAVGGPPEAQEVKRDRLVPP